MRLPLVLLALPLLLVLGTPATAEDRLSVRTSLGPLAERDDTRDLRARGTAPRGSTLVVRFFRGSRHIATRRPKVTGTRYATAKTIDRTGDYSVRVVATRRDGTKLRVSARLTYGPTAEAPSAP